MNAEIVSIILKEFNETRFNIFKAFITNKHQIAFEVVFTS